MRTRIKIWGNSLAVRIPRAFAADVHLENDSLVNIEIDQGRLIVEPVVEPTWTLDELLAGVTEENRPHEVSTGSPMGQEVW
jgi:antitoxin MazE